MNLSFIEKVFCLKKYETNIKTEIIAGVTTFLTMSYILAVNPTILSEAGMSKEGVFVATVVVAVIGTLTMGLLANWPIGLAPGLGLNAFFTYSVVLGMGYTWQVALGAVFWSGVLFFIISVTRIRKYLLDGIPTSLRLAIGAGVGIFIMFIGLKSAGIVVDNPATFLAIGKLPSLTVLLAIFGFFLIILFESLHFRGSVILSILSVTILSFILGINQFGGVVGTVPSISPVFLELDIMGAIQVSMVSVIVTLLFVDFFDTAGTLTSVQTMMDRHGKRELSTKALAADSTATIVGSLCGTSNTTSYVESSTGIQAGGRTGLTAVTIALLFLVSLVFFPLINSIPAYATAPALIYVGLLIFKNIAGIDFSDVTEAIPASITILMVPLTFSIGNGILLGFISYFLIKLIFRKNEDLNLSIIVLAIIGIVNFAFLV